jgi:hypothetical protein
MAVSRSCSPVYIQHRASRLFGVLTFSKAENRQSSSASRFTAGAFGFLPFLIADDKGRANVLDRRRRREAATTRRRRQERLRLCTLSRRLFEADQRNWDRKRVALHIR